MVHPPSNGRRTKVLDGVSGGASWAYSDPIDDLLMFNDVVVYLNNQHATQTVDYCVQVTVDRRDTTNAEWVTVISQATLAANTAIVLTHTDAVDLDAPWDAIRVGYIRTDGSNLGTLYAWVARR